MYHIVDTVHPSRASLKVPRQARPESDEPARSCFNNSSSTVPFAASRISGYGSRMLVGESWVPVGACIRMYSMSIGEKGAGW